MSVTVDNLFNYNETDYFKDKDCIVLYIPNIKRFYIVKPELCNGNWFGANYKLTSVKTCSWDDIYHLEVCNGTGTVTKYLDCDTIGINWKQGINPLPMFWQNINNLIKV